MKLKRNFDVDKILTHGNRKLRGNFGPNGYFTNEDSGEIIEATFENKLRQSRDYTKTYYTILKNELMSYGCYDHMGKEYEMFRQYEKVVARLSIYCGRVRLSLLFDKKRKIKGFKEELKDYESFLISNGIIEMYVDEDSKCDNALKLIGILMRDLKVNKLENFVEIDYKEIYQTLDNVRFLNPDDETKPVPELVVRGKGKGMSWWILIILLALCVVIGVGSCELYQTKQEIRYPTFNILDVDDNVLLSELIAEREINLFDDPSLGGAKIIYPGRQSAYYFYIANTNDYTFTCSMDFTEVNLEDINMMYRLRFANATNPNSPWLDIHEINHTNITVSANSKLLCVLEWKWQDADNDTEIGERGLATYKLIITFSDFAKIENPEKAQ